MLDTSFEVYTNGASELVRTLSYSIPDELQQQVVFVSPTTYSGTTKTARAVSSPKAGGPVKRDLHPDCSRVFEAPNDDGVLGNHTMVGPECLKTLYNISDYKAMSHLEQRSRLSPSSTIRRAMPI